MSTAETLKPATYAHEYYGKFKPSMTLRELATDHYSYIPRTLFVLVNGGDETKCFKKGDTYLVPRAPYPYVPPKDAELVTISKLIERLQVIKDSHGDMPCVLLDEHVGYPASVISRVALTKGYNEKGYFKLAEGDEKVCVITGPWYFYSIE